MDKYEKCAAALMELGDNIIAEKKRRSLIIRKLSFVVSGLCAAVLIAIGVLHNSAISTPPDPEKYSESNIVVTSQTRSDVISSNSAVTTVAYEKKVSTAITGTEKISVTSVSTIKRPAVTEIVSQTTEIIFTNSSVTDGKGTIPVTTTGGNEPSPVNPVEVPIPLEHYRTLVSKSTGIQYTKVSGILSTDSVSELIETQLLVDQDKDGEISCNAELFAIKGISSEVMIAVKYSGSSVPALYRNQDYMPKDLGEFAADLGWEKNGDFVSAEYSDYSSGYELRDYYGFKKEMIINYLLDNADAVCYKYSDLTLDQINPKINIIYDMNEIVPLKAGFGISSKGYLTTNITGGGLAFFIGEETAADIIESVTNNYPFNVLNQ